MTNATIIVLATALLLVLLHSERSDQRGPRLFSKTALSLLFILAALVQPKPVSAYFTLVLIALVFSLGGDVFLALREERMFLYGTISFLIGHLFYILAFFYLAMPGAWTITGTVVTAILSGAVYLWFRDSLGKMKIPVIAYILVISLMMVGAWSLLGTTGVSHSGRGAAFAGAFCFYLSDIFVARNQFLQPSFFNRLIGLPLYYLGQFLLAFSIGLIGPQAI
ncbi:MAG: lysoplasmalogenase [Smithellaceae bacterium]|nr:lysoplasmalogenase [Smithellaceae bacterium]